MSACNELQSNVKHFVTSLALYENHSLVKSKQRHYIEVLTDGIDTTRSLQIIGIFTFTNKMSALYVLTR